MLRPYAREIPTEVAAQFTCAGGDLLQYNITKLIKDIGIPVAEPTLIVVRNLGATTMMYLRRATIALRAGLCESSFMPFCMTKKSLGPKEIIAS